ncbi:MAG: hypothetical protein GY929_19800 [Actinomycetia bacterium]|nr:hypothetical protein [Actinomycetes bacterium]
MALALLSPTKSHEQAIALDGELSFETPASALPIDRLCDLVAELTDVGHEHAIDAVLEAHDDLGATPDPLDLVARALVKLRRGTAADRARLAQPLRYAPHGSLRRWERSRPAAN